MRVLALCLLSADSTGHRPERERVPKEERLGNTYSYVRQENDRGLPVEVWRNLTLDRDESWYKPSPHEYFMRTGKDLYVLGVHGEGEWKTRPAVRRIFREGEWKRHR